MLRRRLRRNGRGRHAIPRASGRGEREDRLRGARTHHRSVRRAEARRTAGALGGCLCAATLQCAPAGHRVLARKRRCGARHGRACHRSDVSDAAGRHRLSRTGSVPGGAAGQRGQSPHSEPGIGVRPRANCEDPRPGSQTRRDRSGGKRRRVRRERGAVDSGTDGGCRAPSAAARQDRAHPPAVDAAPREIVADAGGYHTTSAKCALRAACHSCGAYRVPSVDVEAKAVYTNNPNAGAMRGFGSNQAQFAIEGVMDILAERVGVDGWDIRERNILNPGDAFGTGQIMRESVRGIRETLNAVRSVYKRAKYKGIGCGVKSTGLGNGTIEGGYITIHVLPNSRLEILNGYTEMGQGVYTATMQAVCEETGLPADIMTVRWDKDLGEKCGETWASRATTLSCAAAQRAARKLAEDLTAHTLDELVGREYYDECVYNFTTRPGTPEAVTNPNTHLTFSYAAQVALVDERGLIERFVVANDVGRAINPRLCAEQMEGGVHMGLGYALSEDFTSTDGRPDSLALKDLGIVRARHMPQVDVILIEVPDEIGGYGAKGVGEIGCVATASAVAGALHSYDGIRRFKLPMDDAPAAASSVPRSRSNLKSQFNPQSTVRSPQDRERGV
ncbi:MAG: hypothetical protein DMG03_18070 [Acidobacteria bacterium]|nr:MAG: hypothetical protein DMG03_18070 [Acidobacteriota bacterium]